MKRILAGASALAVTLLGLFTLIPAAHASPVAAVRAAPVTTVFRHPQVRALLVQVRLHAGLPLRHVVRGGDTLAGLAVAYCHGVASDWTGFYHDNERVIGGNPNLIYPGQVLSLNRCTDPPALLHLGSTYHHHAVVHASTGSRIWDVTYGYPNYCGDGDGDGWDVSCTSLHPVYAAPLQRSAPVSSGNSDSGHVSPFGSSFQQCVISRESGGNPGAVNASSGAGGLYQFLPSTWSSLGYGGLPENAPVWEQNQAFQKLYAQAGTSPWSPSDGC